MDVLSQSEGRRWRYWAENGVAGGATQRGLGSLPLWRDFLDAFIDDPELAVRLKDRTPR
jgi:hypothetical protein